MKTILVTGGTGYIGSHTCVELINAGYDVVVLDNLYNSKKVVLDRIETITGKKPKFYEVDILDRAGLDKVFKENKIDAVIHFAGYKAVGESCVIPLTYYKNNISGSVNLYEAMKDAGVMTVVFSSSATVYGDPASVPIKEDFPLSTTNPYGTTKLYNERILEDVSTSDEEWSVMLLRYFNPIGAHKTGLLGETPNGIPNNLVPYVAQVATGQREYLRVWGNDYNTVDGTGVRDYIHVVDLALGHIKAVEYALEHKGVEKVNLGTGIGYSVLQVKDAFAKASGKEIPYQIMERRPGDIATCYADTEKAKEVLGWTAQYGIDEMCQDGWNFTLKNPNGIE
ncbi:UDP-glucose 4-epimerase GalE [Anaerorhabdus furcosa]|uniref:UDP-glucose 4-epimerase n=1 Tax=Anaerorhabdus furcosa TaxID=118967 RepID=A0A1T4P234_9FIRM|nr:UDP-glucose 4-epimerase GalE [Anaerorhabdus furcosa]SJZ85519.1 UDP-glucose 4-epimerase [Anaerorhabdus furcosa]